MSTDILTQKKELRLQKQGEWKAAYDALPRVDGLVKATEGQYTDLRARQEELNFIGSEISGLMEEAKARQVEADMKIANPLGGGVGGQAPEQKDLWGQAKEQFTDSATGKFAMQKEKFYDFTLDDGSMKQLITGAESKTTFTTSAGYAPATIRDGTVVPIITRPLQMIDMIRVLPAGSSNAYMEETTLTNNTVENTENTAMTESALAYTQRSDTFITVGTFIPVTEEQLEDASEVQDLIQNRLVFMVRQRLDRQIMIGDGSAPNLRGLYTASGIQTQARGSDTTLDAIFKAMMLVQGSNAYSIPNVIATTTSDYGTLALTKDTTGRYLLGDPQAMQVRQIWGLPLVLHDSMTADTGLVADTTWAKLRVKHDVRVRVSDSHASTFISNVLTMKAEMRVAFRIERGAANCKITDFTP